MRFSARPLPQPTSSTSMPRARAPASPGTRGRMASQSEATTVWSLSSAITSWKRW